jgi:hypothetical protein
MRTRVGLRACVAIVTTASVFACSGQAPTSDRGELAKPLPIKELSIQALTPQPTTQTALTPASLDADGNPPADYVFTPGGFFHKSCVHQVPNGSHSDDQNNVTANGVTIHYPSCQYASIPILHASADPTGKNPTIGHSWVASTLQTASDPGFNISSDERYRPSIPCKQ